MSNVVARTGGLLAVAAVPLVGGLEGGGLEGGGLTDPQRVGEAFAVVGPVCAGLLLAAGLLCALLVRTPGAESGPARGGPAPAQPPGKSGRSGGSGPSY